MLLVMINTDFRMSSVCCPVFIPYWTNGEKRPPARKVVRQTAPDPNSDMEAPFEPTKARKKKAKKAAAKTPVKVEPESPPQVEKSQSILVSYSRAV